jgi:hypothetical protein
VNNVKMAPVESSPVSRLGGAPEAILAEVLVYSKQALLAKYAVEHGEYLIGVIPPATLSSRRTQSHATTRG